MENIEDGDRASAAKTGKRNINLTHHGGKGVLCKYQDATNTNVSSRVQYFGKFEDHSDQTVNNMFRGKVTGKVELENQVPSGTESEIYPESISTTQDQ